MRPVNNMIVGQGLLQPFPVGVTNRGGNIAPVPMPMLLGGGTPAPAAPSPAVTAPAVTSYPPSSYMAPQAASMPMRQTAAAPQPYDDAIMRNARGIGLAPTGLLGQTPAAPAAQQQPGLFGDFFGTSFDDPRTRRNLAGAAALLEAGGKSQLNFFLF